MDKVSKNQIETLTINNNNYYYNNIKSKWTPIEPIIKNVKVCKFQ